MSDGDTVERLTALETKVKETSDQMTRLELAQSGTKNEIGALENLLAENTRVTKEALNVARQGLEVGRRVEKSTSGVVQAFDSAKGGLKVLGVLGKIAAALSAIASFGTVLWLAFVKWFSR